MKHPRVNRKAFFISATCLLFGLSGCKGVATVEDDNSLPYIGHHDIAIEKTEKFNVGDTIYHTVPDFSYINQDSLVVSSDDLRGRVWIAKFFFANCPTICPPMTTAMQEVHDSLEGFHDELYFLAFSIDPERDSPSRILDYMTAHQIKGDNWYFFTGRDEDETHDLGVHGFYVHADADDAAPGGFAHSSNFVLVDKNRHIRGVYDGLDPDERSRLIKDVKKLVNKDGGEIN
jgi:protein SCO1/2